MKKGLFTFVALALGMMMTSCGVATYVTTNRNVTQSNVDLTQKNYRVVGIVQGEAEAKYVFGIGGLSKRAAQANATANMMKNAHLSGSQAIINTTIEEKILGCAPFYVKRRITSYGQVIEFTE